MYNYYSGEAIPIILNRFKVKNIVISGCSDNEMISQISNYCHDNDAVYVTIDSRDGLEQEYNDYTLNVLPDLKDYDAVFLNDDPNWFTVFNELNIINESNSEFPLVFICHNIFPHKRRDSYIDPELIPIEFRKDSSKFLHYDEIFISDGFYHAIEEDTPKNGVLTAIEDFLSYNPSVGMSDIKLLNGVSILYLKNGINHIRWGKLENEIEEYSLEFDDLSDNIVKDYILTNHVMSFDEEYNNIGDNFESLISQKDSLINDYENKIQLHANEINYKDSQIKSIVSQLRLKNSEIINIESKLSNKENEITYLKDKLSDTSSNVDFFKSELSKKEFELNNRVKLAQQELNEISSDISYNNIQLKIKNEQLEENETRLSNLKNQYKTQLSKLENKEYCICCLKEEISNNSLEISYLKKNRIIKQLLIPFTYLFLIFKSKHNEIFLNYKLYKLLRNSKCFDIGYYLNKNDDLQGSVWYNYFSLELHYICFGFYEGRKFNKKYFNRNSKKELLDYILICND